MHVRRWNMRRVLTAVAISAAILVATSPVATAGPPTIVKFPKGTSDLGNLNDGPTGPVCTFPVHGVVQSLGGGHAILFDGQGVAYEGFGFGALRLTITNMDTGKSVTVNISGPGGITSEGLPVTGWGPWAIFEPISKGGIRFFHGRMEFVPVSYGVHAILLSGTEEDLCDRVA
jgi:hypothetical protein